MKGGMFGFILHKLDWPSDNTNYDESMIRGTVAMCCWKPEEAEMPSDKVVASSLRDELYFHRYEGCQRLEDHVECQLGYVSRLILPFLIF